MLTFVSRCNYGICLLALALALVGPGWAQTPKPLNLMLTSTPGRLRSWTRRNSN